MAATTILSTILKKFGTMMHLGYLLKIGNKTANMNVNKKALLLQRLPRDAPYLYNKTITK